MGKIAVRRAVDYRWFGQTSGLMSVSEEKPLVFDRYTGGNDRYTGGAQI